MNSTDTIALSKSFLYIQFGLTGELQSVSSLRLDQGVTFTKDGNTITARYHNAASPFPIERFASEALALGAYQHLQKMVRRHSRQRRLAGSLKAMLLWGALPAFGFMFMLVLNLALTRGIGNNTLATLPMVANANAAPALPQTRPAHPGASELAQAMSDGTKAGKFSIAYSNGPKGTMYVFSDPSCPSCRTLDHEMIKLAKDYTIHIFPVSVIGGIQSASRLGKLMCARADARASMWKKVIVGADLSGENCSEGAASVAANDQIFRAMHFDGTPTIINGAGDKFPDSSPNTSAAIQEWMKASNTRR